MPLLCINNFRASKEAVYFVRVCEDFKVIGEFMLKKVRKALAAWFLVYKYLGYRGSPVKCFFKKETVMALY